MDALPELTLIRSICEVYWTQYNTDTGSCLYQHEFFNTPTGSVIINMRGSDSFIINVTNKID